MGQAKRRREALAHEGKGNCNGCNLCCVVFEIPEIKKAPFVPCEKLCAAGCSIHNLPIKPATCIDFECNYVVAHKFNMPTKDIIPHPNDCGAYASQPTPDGRKLVLYVDPSRPEKWKTSAMPAYLKSMLRKGIKLTVVDRGYEFQTEIPEGVDHMLSIDMVAAAAAQGLKPTIVARGE